MPAREKSKLMEVEIKKRKSYYSINSNWNDLSKEVGID